MREPEPVFDEVDGHYHNPTRPQRDALLRLPVAVRPDGTLPASAPHGGTLKALERKGYATWTGEAWHRTALGRRITKLICPHDQQRRDEDNTFTCLRCGAMSEGRSLEAHLEVVDG